MHRELPLRRLSCVSLLGFGLALSVGACVSDVGEEPESGVDPAVESIGEKPGETVAPLGFVKPGSAEGSSNGTAEVASAGVDNTYALGVIPYDGHTCPVDSPLVSLYMDDEDDSNRSDHEWDVLPQTPRRPVANLTNSSGTMLRFCKVNGQNFKPLTTDVTKKERFYATLKLGQFCPNGSLDMFRRIDNEDSSNENFTAGPISPNESPLEPSQTTLRFCFFRTGASRKGTTMTSFPDLGIGYGVYHDYDVVQPTQFLSKGWIFTDDEDDNNLNDWPKNTAEAIDFGALVGGGANTMLDIGWVR